MMTKMMMVTTTRKTFNSAWPTHGHKPSCKTIRLHTAVSFITCSQYVLSKQCSLVMTVKVKCNQTIRTWHTASSYVSRCLMTLTYDLLIPKPNQFNYLLRCTNNKSLVKIHWCITEISQKQSPKIVFFGKFVHPVTLTFHPLPSKTNQFLGSKRRR